MPPFAPECDGSSSTNDDDFSKDVSTPLHESGNDDTLDSSSRHVHFGTVEEMGSPRHTKHVSFHTLVGVQEVLSYKNYTEEELKATWFDVDDMRRMKITARTEARLLENKCLMPSKAFTQRGLECRTKNGANLKKTTRSNSFAAVFLEIEYQREEKIYDEQAIVDAYFTYSLPAALAAQRLAKRDAIEAKRCWSPDGIYRKSLTYDSLAEEKAPKKKRSPRNKIERCTPKRELKRAQREFKNVSLD